MSKTFTIPNFLPGDIIMDELGKKFVITNKHGEMKLLNDSDLNTFTHVASAYKEDYPMTEDEAFQPNIQSLDEEMYDIPPGERSKYVHQTIKNINTERQRAEMEKVEYDLKMRAMEEARAKTAPATVPWKSGRKVGDMYELDKHGKKVKKELNFDAPF